MQFECGTYTGDGGGETVSLNEITATPDFVCVAKTGGTATFRYPCYRMTGMTDSQRWGDSNTLANAITALGAGSFTVGTDTHVHENTATYVWFALYDDSNSDFEVGSYTGNASATQDIATGLSNLECVFVFPDASANDCWHCLSMGGTTDASYVCGNSGPPVTGYITDISTTAGQFTAGSNINTDGNTYRYIAFAPVSGVIDSIGYSGNSTNGRNLDVDPNNGGNTPEFACTGNNTAANTRFNKWRCEENSRGLTGDESMRWDATGSTYTNRMEGFSSETVTLGDNTDVNVTGQTYDIFWFTNNPADTGTTIQVPTGPWY